MPVACGLLACGFARTLGDEGRNWEVICFYRREYNEALTPAPYPHLSWYGHVVAMSDGVIFDPALNTPKDIESYKREMFPGQDVFFRHMEPVVSGENAYVDMALPQAELPGRAGVARPSMAAKCHGLCD